MGVMLLSDVATFGVRAGSEQRGDNFGMSDLRSPMQRRGSVHFCGLDVGARAICAFTAETSPFLIASTNFVSAGVKCNCRGHQHR